MASFIKTLPENEGEFQRSALFSDVNPEDLKPLHGHTSFKVYAKGDMLFHHGDDVTSIYVVTLGWLKLFRETLDGQEAVLGLATTGDIIGESNFERKKHLFSAQAISETHLLKISREKLKEVVMTNGALALKFIAALNLSINRLELQVEQASTMTAAQRIGCFILRLCGGRMYGSMNIEFPFDKMLIASSLGMKRETFSRALKELKSMALKVNGNVIFIPEIARLVKFSCGSCSLSSYYCRECL